MKTEWSDLKEVQVSQEETEYFDSQEKNIFKGAKFSDRFITNNGRIAVYVERNTYDDEYPHSLLVDKTFDDNIPNYDTLCFAENGSFDLKDNTHPLNIVSRYQEPIDEDFLNSIGLTKENNYCITIELPSIINHHTATIFVNNETKCWQIKRNIISDGIESIYSCYIGILYNKEDVTRAIELCDIDINLFKNLTPTLQ